jgi:hypothetical protein
MAQKVNIIIDQGTTFNTDFSFVDDNDDPIDFSSYTGASQIRKSAASSTAFSFTVSLGNNGIISLSMNAATTSSITAGRYLYDLEIQNTSSNTVSRLVEGIVTVTPEITR